MKAPLMAAKAIDVSMFTSVLGSIPCSLKAHSNVISGIPPFLPPIISFPFKSSNVKLSIFSLDTKKLPSFCVSCAKVFK